MTSCRYSLTPEQLQQIERVARREQAKALAHMFAAGAHGLSKLIARGASMLVSMGRIGIRSALQIIMTTHLRSES